MEQLTDEEKALLLNCLSILEEQIEKKSIDRGHKDEIFLLKIGYLRKKLYQLNIV